MAAKRRSRVQCLTSFAEALQMAGTFLELVGLVRRLERNWNHKNLNVQRNSLTYRCTGGSVNKTATDTALWEGF